MPANLITLPHFAVSPSISSAKSAGEPEITVAPRSANRALILGSARPALISLFSLSMMSAGVPFGPLLPASHLSQSQVQNRLRSRCRAGLPSALRS